MPRPRRLLAVGLAAVGFLGFAWLVPGCNTEPVFNAEVDYSPASLAQELIFRAKDLPAAARRAEKKRTGVAVPETKGQSKSAQTKKAEVKTLDDVLDDVADKARRIKSAPAAEIFKQIAAVVSKDSSLEPKDRDAIVAKLDEMATAAQ